MNILSFFLRPKKNATSLEELTEEVGALRARIKTIELELEDRHETIMTQLRRINSRHNMRERRESDKMEEQELQAALMSAGIDLADPEAMKNPQEIIQKAMQNPAIMQIVMKKLGSELL